MNPGADRDAAPPAHERERRREIRERAVIGTDTALLTMAVTLCNAGLLSRAELAAAFDEAASLPVRSGALK